MLLSDWAEERKGRLSKNQFHLRCLLPWQGWVNAPGHLSAQLQSQFERDFLGGRCHRNRPWSDMASFEKQRGCHAMGSLVQEVCYVCIR